MNSPVGANIANSIFVCVFVLLLQHFYNKKLDEHQIRFKNWNEEKIKATKVLYAKACDLACSMGRLHFAESNSPKNGENSKEEETKDLKKQADLCYERMVNSWLKLRLFLDEDEDNLYYTFIEEIKTWHDGLCNPDEKQRDKFIQDNQAVFLSDIEIFIVNKFRTIFRMSMKIDTIEKKMTYQRKQNGITR